MATLSVDLTHKTFADIGAVVLSLSKGSIDCSLRSIDLDGTPTPAALARHLDLACRQEGIEVLLLDGPQGWKSNQSDLVHARRCERALNTPAKSGLPGIVKPSGYLNFVRFCVATYDALGSFGWNRLSKIDRSLSGRVLVETFPLSAWRTLGLSPLPAKRKAKAADIEACLQNLRELFPLRLEGAPSHDQLQALVAGLAGLAIEDSEWDACPVSGEPPAVEDGEWREGWIVNRRRP